MTRCTSFFFFNDTATTEIYTLSLHDALPISPSVSRSTPGRPWCATSRPAVRVMYVSEWKVRNRTAATWRTMRSEEHTSELQSQSNLVCRLLLEKKKKHHRDHTSLVED